jgi:hypothetical protein
MIYILIVYNVIAILCIVYAVFNPMDVLSWLWVKGKTFFVWLYNLIKGKK